MSEHRAARITPAFLTVKRRRYLYRLGNAGIAVAVGYGVLTGEQGLIWAALLAPLLALADDNAN